MTKPGRHSCKCFLQEEMRIRCLCKKIIHALTCEYICAFCTMYSNKYEYSLWHHWYTKILEVNLFAMICLQTVSWRFLFNRRGISDTTDMNTVCLFTGHNGGHLGSPQTLAVNANMKKMSYRIWSHACVWVFLFITTYFSISVFY